jgi:AraC family transcriptional activator of pyochelin receptor
MHILLNTALAGEIRLSPELPPQLRPYRLPGSICYGAAGPFGHVLFQELDGDGISIRHTRLYFEEDDRLVYRSEEPALRLQVMLNNSLYYEAGGLGEKVLHERGFSLNYVPSIDHRMTVRARGQYSHLSVNYRPGDLQQLQSSFPALPEFLRKVLAKEPGEYSQHYCIADSRMIMLADSMLGCPYTGRLRSVYLHSLAMEILVLALVTITEKYGNGRLLPVAREDAERVYAAKRVLLDEIDQPISLPELAGRAGLSAYKLNGHFKAIYGIGVVEWLYEQRMERAHRALQETQLSLGDIARKSGYSGAAAFGLAFKKRYGYAPAFVQKNGKM